MDDFQREVNAYWDHRYASMTPEPIPDEGERLLRTMAALDAMLANAVPAPRHSVSDPSQQSTLPSRPFGECRLSRSSEND